MSITTRVQNLLKTSNLKSFAELERACGFANGTIGKWRDGAYKPSLEYLIKLADYFDVSIDYLVGRSDDPARH